jgi:hypothetical protein
LSRCGARRIERPVRLNDHRPRARGTVSPSVSGNVIDRVRRYLRRVDRDISGLLGRRDRDPAASMQKDLVVTARLPTQE